MPKDTFCMFTLVKRGLWQLWKIFSNFPRSRHLPVQTQQLRITSITKYLLKITNNNTSKKPLTPQIYYSKSTIKTQNQELKSFRSVVRSGVLIVNFENISYLALLFVLLLWTSNCLNATQTFFPDFLKISTIVSLGHLGIVALISKTQPLRRVSWNECPLKIT